MATVEEKVAGIAKILRNVAETDLGVQPGIEFNYDQYAKVMDAMILDGEDRNDTVAHLVKIINVMARDLSGCTETEIDGQRAEQYAVAIMTARGK